MELCDLSAVEISRRVHSREVSASEVLESALERIAAVDGRPGSLDPGEITPQEKARVHAFITHTEQRSRQQAQALDRALAAGEDPGALAGG